MHIQWGWLSDTSGDMLDTTTRVHVIKAGPSMAQGDIRTPKALHSVKGSQLNLGFHSELHGHW